MFFTFRKHTKTVNTRHKHNGGYIYHITTSANKKSNSLILHTKFRLGIINRINQYILSTTFSSMINVFSFIILWFYNTFGSFLLCTVYRTQRFSNQLGFGCMKRLVLPACGGAAVTSSCFSAAEAEAERCISGSSLGRWMKLNSNIHKFISET